MKIFNFGHLAHTHTHFDMVPGKAIDRHELHAKSLVKATIELI